MNRYIITSPKFTGEIYVLYGPDNKLMMLDFMNSDLNETQIEYFKAKVPVFYSERFTEAFGNSSLTVVQEGYTVTFEQFWDRYKMKRNKDRCMKLWARLSEGDRVNAYAGLITYERHLGLNTWKSKADPDTYLRNKYWENEWK